MCDSARLREEFNQPEIEDGWEVLAEGDGAGNYGCGSRDLLMFLRKAGEIYCQESDCCSCEEQGIEGTFAPTLASLKTIEMDLAQFEGAGYADPEKARVCREALGKLAAT